MAFLDARQFHPGHVLVIPKKHMNDVREIDEATGSSLMSMVARIARAVSAEFPNQGLSLWHSIGEAAFQEVPHLHIHVHPRLGSDGLLRVYPQSPPTPDRPVLERYAAALRSRLSPQAPQT